MEPLPGSSFEVMVVATVIVLAGVAVAGTHLDAFTAWADGIVRAVAAAAGVSL
jgi:hypothetical protein